MSRGCGTVLLVSSRLTWPDRPAIRAGGIVVALLLCAAGSVRAQEAQPATREEATVAEQQKKAANLRPYTPNRVEAFVARLEESLASGPRRLHPFFDSAYNGGGLTLGAGWRQFVSPYNTIDVRGSVTVKGYKRIEAEYQAPHMFGRRGTLSILGGWREATQVGFYGLGTEATSQSDRANYSFTQSQASANVRFRPVRVPLIMSGGLEIAKWTPGEGRGDAPSIETVHTEETAPGLNARPTYLHSQASLGFDTRPSPFYARRGSYLGVTFHDYTDLDETNGFRALEYQAIQHVPLLHDVWVLSLRATVTTTDATDGQVVPYFMMPAIGGGSTLRGFSSWRFRDRHTLLVGAEWRVLANRFLDMAVFYDAGKAVASRRHLDLQGLKSNYGVGLRFHGPATTALRIEVARSNEKVRLVFATSAAF
jgi:hypothetical protein